MAPRRYTNGVTNVRSNNVMGQLIVPDPTSVVTYMEDFFKFDPGEWITTRSEAILTASDTGTASYEQVSDATNGILTCVTNISDDDYVFFQYGGADYDATADAPRVPTKYISTTAKVDSIINSKIIGTANRKIAFPKLIFV